MRKYNSISSSYKISYKKFLIDLILILLFCNLLYYPKVGYAQQELPKYSLADIFNQAKLNNKLYLSNFPNQQAAVEKFNQTRSFFLPQVVLQGKSQYSSSSINNTSYNGVSNSLALGLNQVIYKKDLFIQLKQANNNIELSKIQLDTAQNNLAIKCAQSYFNILEAQDNIELLAIKKKNIFQQLQLARKNFEVGNSTITDMHESQARYDQTIADEIAAKNNLVIQQQELNNLLGKSIYNLQLKPINNFEIKDINIEENINIEQNLNVKASYLNNIIASLNIDKAKANYYPTIELIGGVSKDTSTMPMQPGKSAFVSVNFSMPLFSGFSTKSLINEMYALKQKTNLEYQNIIEQTNLNIYQLKNTLSSLAAQYEAFLSARNSAILALNSNNLAYKVGLRINIDVLNAQEQLFNAEKNLKKIRYEILLNILKLKSLGKVLTNDDLKFI